MFKLKRKNDENTNENIEISAEEEMKVEEKTPKVETSDETTQTVSVLSVDDNAIKKEKKSKSGEKIEEKKEGTTGKKVKSKNEDNSEGVCCARSFCERALWGRLLGRHSKERI